MNATPYIPEIDPLDVLSPIRAQIVVLNDSVSTLETNVGVLETEVAGVETALVTVDTEIQTLTSDVAALQSDLAGVDARLQTVEGEVATLTTEVDTLQTDLTSVESTLTALDTLWTTYFNSTYAPRYYQRVTTAGISTAGTVFFGAGEVFTQGDWTTKTKTEVLLLSDTQTFLPIGKFWVSMSYEFKGIKEADLLAIELSVSPDTYTTYRMECSPGSLIGNDISANVFTLTTPPLLVTVTSTFSTQLLGYVHCHCKPSGSFQMSRTLLAMELPVTMTQPFARP